MRQITYPNNRYCLIAALFVVFAVCALAGCTTKVIAPEYKQIVIATGSPFELGLVDELAKAFQKKHGGTVRCIKTPTGPGLDLGRHGLTHITMGHERAATARFVGEGLAARRTDLMHNFTVVVGPARDPAKIKGLKDIREVQKRIYEAKAPYLSRGDGGGMDILERKTWQALKVNPEGQSWYQVSKKFMLASLLDADKNGQYHMLDSSTWTLHKSKTKNLKLLVQGPPNEYEMCLVSADKHPNLKYNQELAEEFYDFLTGEEGQKIIAEFGVKQYGEPVYYPTVIKNPK
jgi:tungstate transport system substrate-binding protein